MNLNIILKGGLVVTCFLLMVSCNKEWDNHYKEQQFSGEIEVYIKSQANLSKFYQMLQIAGYDTVLNKPVAYTVWAIDDSALEGFDLTDTEKVKEVIGNHISRFTVPTSGIQSSYIRTINGKLIKFNINGDGFEFGGKTLEQANILTSNGIVHVVNGFIPYQLNIWEYIQNSPGLDSLKAFVISQNAKIFDPANSIALGVDSSGNTIYDSAFIVANNFMYNIAHIDNEDSVYTAILPNNTAWDEAYSRLKSYFVFSPKEPKGAYYQRFYTQYAVAWNMAFKNRIPDPTIYDSLVSTNKKTFYQPANLFVNTIPVELSNGIANVTDKIPFKPTDLWNSEIRVEAEWTKDRTHSNGNVYTRNSYGTPFNVSNKNYLMLEPTTTSDFSKVYVDFSIPGTLSAKYNIYCVFVPAIITTPTDLRPNKAAFFISYNNASGNLEQRKPLSVPNNITDPNGITKMLIASNFKFPVCDMSLTSNYVPVVKIRVQNDATMVQERNGLYSRTMRIDCIILEPVTE